MPIMKEPQDKRIDKLNDNNIVGSILQQRYKIESFIDQGSNGTVYDVYDTKNPQEHFVVKLSSEYKDFAMEINMMRRISEHSFGKYSCPKVVAYGMAAHKDNLMAWVIMPRYGRNLEYICQKMQYKLLKSSIYDIGNAILTTLEAVHKAGYVYNDLKLDNLMVGYNQKIYKKTNGCSMFTECSMHLVDFGYATKYKDKMGKHISKGEVSVFRGNIMFSSLAMQEF